MKILVLEDNFFLRREIVALLTKRHLVEATDSPHKAMQYLNQTRFDYCLVNLFLADYTGLEFIYEVNTWPDLGHLKFVLLSFEIHYFQEAEWLLEDLQIKSILHPLDLKTKILQTLR